MELPYIKIQNPCSKRLILAPAKLVASQNHSKAQVKAGGLCYYF